VFECPRVTCKQCAFVITTDTPDIENPKECDARVHALLSKGNLGFSNDPHPNDT